MLDPDMLRRLAGAMAAAAQLAVIVTAGVFLGAWLDSRLHTAPFLLLFLALAGLVAGFVRLTRWLQSSDAEDDDSTDPKPGDHRR